MEISLPALIGAFVGTVIAVINYGMLIALMERRLRALDKSQTPEQRADFERKISLMRRIVLGTDVLLFAAVGYWFGKTIGG
jgi:hypothetical protein